MDLIFQPPQQTNQDQRQNVEKQKLAKIDKFDLNFYSVRLVLGQFAHAALIARVVVGCQHSDCFDFQPLVQAQLGKTMQNIAQFDSI